MARTDALTPQHSNDMAAPLNAELAAWTSSNILGSLHIRLLALKVAPADVDKLAADLLTVKGLWDMTASRASSLQATLAANEWESAKMLDGPKYMTIYKYFCAPRIYLNPAISAVLEVPYNENDGLVKAVHTHTLKPLAASAGWDVASQQFIERDRGLELVGMGYGWWLVTTEEQNQN